MPRARPARGRVAPGNHRKRPDGHFGRGFAHEFEGLGKMYQLDAEVEKLNEHVGHKVEIVGSVAGAADAAKPTGTSGAAAGTVDQAPVPMLRVESIKMISATCPRS